MDKDILVSEYREHWLLEHRKTGVNGKVVKDTSFAEYVFKSGYIIEEFGNRKINELAFEEIYNFLQDMNYKHSSSTAKQVRNLFYSMLAFAKEDGVVEENVLEGKKINFREQKGKKEKKVIEKDDYKKLIDYCNENNEMDILMILFTGIRASELARN